MATESPGYPKTGRLTGPWRVTEKIDGTNAVIRVEPGLIRFGSRNRWLTREQDNHGFCAWGERHQAWLANVLGDGTHYGEWYGSRIQRGYGMTTRTLALFDVSRYEERLANAIDNPGLTLVPVLQDECTDPTEWLRCGGMPSLLGSSPMEGVVLHHHRVRLALKVVFPGQKR